MKKIKIGNMEEKDIKICMKKKQRLKLKEYQNSYPEVKKSIT